jgi:hypothetical protein
MKDNRNFYISTSQKCKYDKLKLSLGFQIRINLDPDLFDRIKILQGAMAVYSEIFHDCIPIGIWVVANPLDLISLILHLWKHCSTKCSFETADFLTEKRFANLSLGLICYSIVSSQPPSRDTVPLIKLSENSFPYQKLPDFLHSVKIGSP